MQKSAGSGHQNRNVLKGFAGYLEANRGLLLVAVLTFGLLIVPDLAFYWTGYQTTAVTKRGSVALAAVLAIALTLIASRRWRLAALAGVLASQALWLGCLAYFGRPLGPEQMLLAVNEARDVTAGIFDGWRVLAPGLLLVGACGAVLYIIQRREFASDTLRRSLGGWPFLVLMLGLAGYWLTHQRMSVAMPGAHTFSAFGPYQSAVSAGRLLMSPVAAAPGMVIADPIVAPIPIEEEPVTIVVIMGEGISPTRLSLFGFDKDTSPRIASWREAPPQGFELIPKIGFSGGVSTLGSVPAFLKMSYWPVEAEWRGINLFDLAAKSGFKTWYLSAQSRHFLDIAGGAPGAERVVAEQGSEKRLSEIHDDLLVELAREIPSTAARRFIFFHQRVNHSNYTSHCSHLSQDEYRALYIFAPVVGGTREEFRRSAYDNGLRCWDRNVDEIARVFTGSPGAVHIVVTADHNEMMGEHGMWGHSQQDLRVAQVPMLLLTNRPGSDFARRFRTMSPPDWHALSSLVARALGQGITTPGARDGRFYLNTTMPFGRSGYFEVEAVGPAKFMVRRYSREGQKQAQGEVVLPEMGTANAGQQAAP